MEKFLVEYKSAVEKKLAEYKCNTNTAIELKLVRFPEDLENDIRTFFPEYTHQLFGDDETAFGYKGLKILLYYIAGSLSTMFRVEYASKVDENFDCVEILFIHETETERERQRPRQREKQAPCREPDAGLNPRSPGSGPGPKADDVEGKIRQIIPPGFCTNTNDFLSLLEKEVDFKPFGTLLHTYSVLSPTGGENFTFQIYKADMTCRGFREYHERLQTFLMWFIETASFIDVDDERWHYFLVFEKYNKDGATLFATVGYMTVYNYYVYPDKTRPRVSQMLILTPFQGQGHGAQLLETVHRYYIASPSVLDITAEDPSKSYVKLRDFVLVKLCQDLPCFSREKLMQGFSEAMAIEAQQKFKINKQHARRVYEILRLLVTDMSDAEQYRSYRLDIKRRLISPYKKKQRDLAKMRKCLRPEELTNQMNQIEISMQHEQLEESFQELVEDYRRVIERLAQE
ncbi:histone acetyltransferase type B catalytic subunit isoform X1 [Canis lupus baileyi]|uniref:histone acetyltransferase type B catalytic subunit isoform X1 n=1 Tax=Canis lupus baileyi TaxID=143281 RepID=UPI003B973958